MSKKIKEGTLLKFCNKSEKEQLEYVVVYMKDGTVKLVCKNNSCMDYAFQTVGIFEQAMGYDYEISLGYKLARQENIGERTKISAPIYFEGDKEDAKIEDSKTKFVKIYEVRDCTDDEMYFSEASYDTLDNAINSIKKDPEAHCSDHSIENDFSHAILRVYEVPLCTTRHKPRCVYEIEYERIFEDEDEGIEAGYKFIKEKLIRR